MLAAAALAISPSLSQTSVHLFVFFHGSPDSPSLDAAGRSHEHHELRVADLHPFHPSSSPLHRRSATAVRSRAPPLPLHRFVVPAARRRGLMPPRAPLAKTHTISGSSSPISHHSAVPAWTSCASAASSDSGSHVCPPPLVSTQPRSPHPPLSIPQLDRAPRSLEHRRALWPRPPVRHG
ncbi:hypothetical protein PVAP13_6NG308840 [Panicum virgatum]|uniref:Uncharacterized protein n=1 Tax=Panicum virgatum TaxID=38727 RepID=A0A8T0R592_PANVG|nr:hypothetical protein PVAP13_6NG308840 [Panicum virgatum]